jgi:hypothetical protein
MPLRPSRYSQVLPHWTSEVNAMHPNIGQEYEPPESIGSNYYPQLGPYSSADPSVIKAHVAQIASAGIGVLVLSWWGRGQVSMRSSPNIANL